MHVMTMLRMYVCVYLSVYLTDEQIQSVSQRI